MIFSLPDFSEEDLPDLPSSMPLLVQAGLCLLPQELLDLPVQEERHFNAIQQLSPTQRFVAVGNVHLNPNDTLDKLYPVLTIGQVVHLELNAAPAHLVLLGIKRARIKSVLPRQGYPMVQTEALQDYCKQTSTPILEALTQELLSAARQLQQWQGNNWTFNPSMPSDYLDQAQYEDLSLGELCDNIGAFFCLPQTEKQLLLEELDTLRRAEKLLFLLRCHKNSHLPNLSLPS